MMSIDDIERYVDDLLEVSGVCRSDEAAQPVRRLLHHLYAAVGMYELMGDDERGQIAFMQKKLRYFFTAKCDLKERKRKSLEKETISPTPPIKEKGTPKEKAEKTLPPAGRDVSARLEERREAFRKACQQYMGKVDTQRLADFYNYWSEENGNGRMRFESQRFWNIERRLKRWMNKSYAAADTAAAIRLKRAKKKLEQEQAASQDVQAQEREQAQQELEQRIEQSKQGAVSYEEWLESKGQRSKDKGQRSEDKEGKT